MSEQSNETMNKSEIHIRVAGENINGLKTFDSVIATVDSTVAEHILACVAQNTYAPISREKDIGEATYVVTLEDMARDAYNRSQHFGVSQDSFYRLAKRVDAARAPLLARIAELEAKVEAAEKDAERLDWLDNLSKRMNEHYGTQYGWKLILSPNVTRLMAGQSRAGFIADIDLNDANGATADREASIRAAIDAAKENE